MTDPPAQLCKIEPSFWPANPPMLPLPPLTAPVAQLWEILPPAALEPTSPPSEPKPLTPATAPTA